MTPQTERRKNPAAAGERLQKVLSQAGISSRRAAEEMIRAGRITVNGKVVTELGTRADPGRDQIRIDKRRVGPPATFVHLLLHKPTGVVTTLADPQGRQTVRTLLGKFRQRVFPVGRLDYHSAGVLLLTNDGELALRLTHPRYHVPKTYRVKVRGQLSAHARDRLSQGIQMTEGRTAPAKVHVVGERDRKTWLEITIQEGRRRQIRRMCEAVGLPVEKLVRISLGPVKLGRLPAGHFRTLTDDELSKLRSAVGLH